MDASLTGRIKIGEEILIKELEDEAVILNLKNESYYGLDEVGTRMWNVLTNSDSIQQAHEILKEEYEVDSDTLLRDIGLFVKDLVENEMVTITNNE